MTTVDDEWMKLTALVASLEPTASFSFDLVVLLLCLSKAPRT